ncbi:L10-interacting MYB domain-containing protein-like [Bidens hawaiensis]|uniref:L10-interacting MYB domain-containing protein-like n=1 Tax=Bidens hawaiensis TaxID=980011 RepID=UPI00404A1984
MVLEFCRFLNKYIMKHGRTSSFKWVSLQPEFEKVINHKFVSDKAMKNKYDHLRKEYNLWKSLKNEETGLGWNESTKQLSCSDEWWKLKIQENPKVIAIQNNQPSIQLQEEWDQLFGDAVASGENCVAPSMDPTTFSEVHVENLEDDNVEGENLETQGNNFYADFLNEVSQPNASTSIPSEVAKKFKKPTKVNTKPTPVKMKRKGRDSLRASMLKDHLTQSNMYQQRALEILESDSSKLSQSTKFSIEGAICVLNQMVDAGLMREDEELWLFAMILFEDPVKREMFINMRHDHSRLAWLQRKQRVTD